MDMSVTASQQFWCSGLIAAAWVRCKGIGNR